MVRFSGIFRGRKPTAINEAGGPAFAKTPETELVDMLFTCFLTSKFYRSESEEYSRFCQLVGSVDPLFAAQAGVYARHVYGMRTITHVLAGELSKSVSGKDWLKDFYNFVCRRPDDMREIAAYILDAGERDKARPARGGRTLPNAVKKGFARAFARFDAYQLGAYRGEGTVMSLVDLVRLVHPQPSEAIDALVRGELRSQKQDVALTQAGQAAETEQEKAQLKAEAWAQSLPRMGYNALILNLRNIVEQAPELTDAVCERIRDSAALRASLILPLQIWQAYLAVGELKQREARKVMLALSAAIDLACENVPELPGRTLVVYDCSGSMGSCRSASGPFAGREPIQIASMFTAVLARALQADVMRFATGAEMVRVRPDQGVLAMAEGFNKAPGGGTDFDAPFRTLREPYDRIILLSDMQGWMGLSTPDSEFRRYKQRCKAPGCRLYTFDLTGYSTAQFPAADVTALSGLSFAVFETFRMVEADRGALRAEIEAVEFTERWVKSAKQKLAGAKAE